MEIFFHIFGPDLRHILKLFGQEILYRNLELFPEIRFPGHLTSINFNFIINNMNTTKAKNLN